MRLRPAATEDHNGHGVYFHSKTRRTRMDERRGAHRYKLPLSVVVKLVPASNEPELLHARTRDVSTGGVYFTTDRKLPVGMKFDLSLTMPNEVTQGSPVIVAAQARVVRQEEKSENSTRRVGIAAQFERYNLVR
jgi:c-di-GMP-binding flagellar brake protein YcgR